MGHLQEFSSSSSNCFGFSGSKSFSIINALPLCKYENINFYKNCGYKENQVQMSLYSNALQSIYRNI